jgi:hypothetical protein
MTLCDKIWAHWNCDEVSGDRADSSGNNRTWVDESSPPSPSVLLSDTGIINLGIRSPVPTDQGNFSLEASWGISRLNDSFDGSSGFAIAYWVRLSPVNEQSASTLKIGINIDDNNDLFDPVVFSVGMSVEFREQYGVGIKGRVIASGTTNNYTENLNIDVWDAMPYDSLHLLILNYDPNTATSTVKMDNALIGSSNTPLVITPIIGTAKANMAGASQFGITNFCIMDEAIIWERPLTAQEETDLWNDGAGYAFTCGTPPTPVFAINRHTLVQTKDLMEGRKGWFFDRYTPNILCHYGEEGSNVHDILCGGIDGGVYQLQGNSDAGTAVPCQITTSSRNQSNPRINKLYGDIMVDCDTDGGDVSAVAQLDNASVSGPATTLNTTTRTQVAVPVNTDWQIAKNINLDLQWNMNGTRAEFFIWEPRYTESGANLYAFSWSTSYISHGMPGYFYHGYLYLAHNSTADLTFDIIGELGTVETTVTISNSGGADHKDFIRLPPTKGKLFKYTVYSTAQFRVFGEESELLVKPWGIAAAWTSIKLFEDVPKEG